MNVGMCACGSPACKYCNPNIWSQPIDGAKVYLEEVINRKNERIVELQAELAEARRALVLISTALDAYGVRWCREVAKDALQEKGE